MIGTSCGSVPLVTSMQEVSAESAWNSEERCQKVRLEKKQAIRNQAANASAISIHTGLHQSFLGSAAARAKVQSRRRSLSTRARSARPWDQSDCIIMKFRLRYWV